MARMGGMVAATAAVLTLSACGGTVDQPFLSAAQGTWTLCETSGLGVAYRHTLTIDRDGNRYFYSMSWDTQGSCTSKGTVAKEVYGTISVGSGVTTGWQFHTSDAPVTAYPMEIDGTWVQPQTGPFQEFNLGYVMTDVTPHRLYLGNRPDEQTGAEPTPPRATQLCGFWLEKS